MERTDANVSVGNLEHVDCRLKGGYRALNMGFPHEAMVDMTGGVTEVLNIAALPRDLPPLLSHLLSKGALINCANSQVSQTVRVRSCSSL